jgi:RecQ-mediated genome instability protein 1
MLLKNVSIRRGIAFLEPKCVTLLGHTTEERDENRLADFAKGLRLRMG